METTIFPEAVFTLWWIAIVLAVVVFVPLSLYLLHSLLRATVSIQRYAGESLTAAHGIGGNVGALPALDTTIAVASETLTAAEAVAAKLDTIAKVLEDRASRLP